MVEYQQVFVYLVFDYNVVLDKFVVGGELSYNFNFINLMYCGFVVYIVGMMICFLGVCGEISCFSVDV